MGLGNQMFQYAAARAVAARSNAPLVLDTAWFDTPEATGRQFGLNHLCIQAHARPLASGLRNSVWARRFDSRVAKEKLSLPIYRAKAFITTKRGTRCAHRRTCRGISRAGAILHPWAMTSGRSFNPLRRRGPKPK